MSDRVDFYFRQRVTEAELDLAFALLEKADRDLAADLGIYGIVSGAVPAPHSPVPDLTVDLTAPARAYDNLGQRMFFGTGQTVDCAVDLVGIPTDVATAGNERWLGIFLRFKRQLSDPRTDGNSQQVFFRRDESFELVVRQAPEGPSGAAPKPALQADELLLCDVLRRPGQTQILATDLDTSRRQAFIFAQGSSVAVATGTWSILDPLGATVQAALDEVDAELREHFTATGRRHSANAIDFTPHGFVGASNVQAALNELVDDLGSGAAGSSGATRVSADAAAGAPHALPAGSVKAQLTQLLGFLNAHVGATSGAHNASAIATLAHSFLSGANVQSQLQELVSALVSVSNPSGASRIGVVDVGGQLNAIHVEGALAELASAFSGDHFRINEANSGQHKTIRQPVQSGTKALLWDARGTGGAAGRFRVIADTDSIWLTMNASWNGSAWARDNTAYYSGALRLSRLEFELLQDSNNTQTFTNWQRRWRLPMSSALNSSFEMVGEVSEVGRLGTAWSNSHTASRSIAAGGSVTFRNRFPTTPSSITLSTNYFTVDNALPSIVAATRDGFGFYGYRTLTSGQWAFWMGTYTATA
ncbi:MAG: hypothetical protein LC099_02435 [Anaerolineales bacterium]|nr:hypothetical protein [Anaerolineales bacterium]